MSRLSLKAAGKLVFWNRATAIAFRIAVGAVFVYASIDKLAHPALFAKDIANYRILPYALVNLFAVILPWTELIVGLCLVLGLFGDAAAAIIGALLLVFIAASAAAIARGLDISCGCFSTTGGTKAGWEVIIRNALLIAMLAHWFSFKLLGTRVPSKGKQHRAGSGGE